MNYFYDTITALQHRPEIKTSTTVSGNGVLSSGDHAQNTHAGQAKIQTIHTNEAGLNTTSNRPPQINALISDYIAAIAPKQMPKFLAIITEIQKDHKTNTQTFGHPIALKTLELNDLRAPLEQEL